MPRTIVIHIPKSYWAYKELIEAMQDALLAYGFDVNINSKAEDAPNKDTYICPGEIDSQFIIWFASPGGFYPPQDGRINVHVETDHIDTPLRKRSPIDYSLYTRSLHWFDYKKDLRDRNIYYCPLGYHERFDTTLPRRDLREHFHMGRTGTYGFRSAFREKYNLWTTTDRVVLGNKRDDLIVSSKVNINSRLMEDYWFTPLHASLITHKGKMLLQEDYGKNDYSIFKPYLVLFTEENFMDTLKYWTSHNEKRREFENFIYEDTKKHRFEDFFLENIKDLLEEYR